MARFTVSSYTLPAALALSLLLVPSTARPAQAAGQGDQTRVGPEPTASEVAQRADDSVEGETITAPRPGHEGSRTKPSDGEDPPDTLYRVVLNLGSGSALHKARELGIDARAGAHTYEITPDLVGELRRAGIETWIVGGTSRFTLRPEWVARPSEHLADPTASRSPEADTAADYGGTVDLDSGSIFLPIEDNTGSAQAYRLRRQDAPAGAQVTTVHYRTRVSDEGDGAFYCGDYELWLFSGDPAYELAVYDNLGGRTDGGYDDDTDDDLDIYLNWRSTSFFSGEDPNQWWGIVAWDNLSGDDGELDYIQFAVDWVVEGGDSYEPDNGPDEAYPMPHNFTSAFRSIDPVGDEDWVELSLADTADVTLETSGPFGDTRLWLYDASLQQIDFDDDGGDGFFSRISRSLASGTYYAQIDEYNDNEVIPDYALSLSVESSQPDLVVDLFRHPTSVTEGDTATVEAEVKNDGGAAAGSSHARLYLSIDGDGDVSDDHLVTPDDAVSSLSAGASDTATWTFSFPSLLNASEYLVWVLTRVDSQGEVSESDEGNLFQSSGYITVTAAGLPNLSISDVYLRTDTGGGGSRIVSPQVGQQVYPHIDFTVEGDQPLSGTLWSIALDGTTLCSSTTTLDPGGYIGWCNAAWTATSGSHLLHAEADPSQAIAESDEADNVAERTVSVSSEPVIRIEPLSLRFEAQADAGGDPVSSGPGPPSLDEPQPLFLEVGASDRGAALSRAATRTRRVVVNHAALARGVSRLVVPLFDGSEVEVHRTGVERRGPDRLTWRGRVVDSGERVVLTLAGRAAAGLLYTPDGLYELGNTPSGAAFARLDSSRFPQCGGGIPVLGPTARTSTLATAGDDPPDQIDVLAVYTADARDGAGGTTEIEATIQSAVDVANTAFMDSDMVARLRLVHTALVDYAESGDSATDLDWVASDADVASLRDDHAADMVGLIVEDGGGYCGRGYVMRNPGASFAGFAFQVTARSCAVGRLTYAHEHGHNMGFEHDPANVTDPSAASYPYSFGHFVSGSYRTVMSYSNQCTSFCTRVAHFSNPGIEEQGEPTGIADERDNHRTGNVTASIVANFRQSTTPSDGFVIHNDGGATLSVDTIQPDQSAPWLTWTPQAPFEVSPGGSTTVQVDADLGAAPTGETTRRLLVESNDSDLSPYPGGVDVTTVTDGSCTSLHLTSLSVTGYEVHEACSTVRADTDVTVHTGGELVLRSGSGVVLGSGFEVRSGGRLTVEIDSNLDSP